MQILDRGFPDESASLIGGFHRRRVEMVNCGENVHAEKPSEEKGRRENHRRRVKMAICGENAHVEKPLEEK